MRLISVLVSCVLLAGCATQHQHNKQALALAKANFAVHNYELAYQHLEPLANDGDKNAQYAIGYLYYYGYGVPRNEERALWWIKQSAEQKKIKAVRALHQIETANASPFHMPLP